MAGRNPVVLSPVRMRLHTSSASCGLQDQAKSFQNLALESWKTPTAGAWLPEVRKLLAKVQVTNH